MVLEETYFSIYYSKVDVEEIQQQSQKWENNTILK